MPFSHNLLSYKSQAWIIVYKEQKFIFKKSHFFGQKTESRFNIFECLQNGPFNKD